MRAAKTGNALTQGPVITVAVDMAWYRGSRRVTLAVDMAWYREAGASDGPPAHTKQ